jgi:hypothetical protein
MRIAFGVQRHVLPDAEQRACSNEVGVKPFNFIREPPRVATQYGELDLS